MSMSVKAPPFTWILSVFLAGILASPSQTHATSFASHVSLDSMAASADLIVVARVSSQSRIPATPGALFSTETHTSLQVLQTLKGVTNSQLTLRQLGGTTQGKRSQVSGDAQLKPGQTVLLYLRTSDAGPYSDFVHLNYLGYSAYDLVSSKTSGVTVARPHLLGAPRTKQPGLRLGQVTTLRTLQARIHAKVGR